ncbi:MAG: ATP-binding protein [Bacteroidota bacterium]
MLSLPSIPESVSVAVDAAEAIVRDGGVSEDVISRVTLAVAEAIANAIEHGSDATGTGEVLLDVQADSDAVRVRVRDGGEGVSASRLQSASLPEDLLQTHGRGLYLIRVLSDEVDVTDGWLHLVFSERST